MQTIGAVQAQGQSLDDRREAWVIKAREGQLNTGIDGLGSLYTETRDRRVRDDLIALLIRAERYQDVLRVCADCHPDSLSPSSLEMLGMAARQTREYAKATLYYQSLTQRQPDNIQGWLGLALTQLARGDVEAVERLLQRMQAREGRTPQWFQTRLELASQLNAPLMELQTRHWMVERSPDDLEAVQALYRLAVELGATIAANRLMTEYPQAFTTTDRQWLRYYRARDQLRLAQTANKPALYAEALSGFNALLDESDADAELVQRVEFDKLATLVKLRRFNEAEQLANALQQRHGELPIYLRQARAEALYGVGRPADSVAIYRELIEVNPAQAHADDEPLNAPLFYAYADLRAFDSAKHVLDDWKSQEPATRWDFTGTQRLGNPNHEQILQLEMLLEAWRGGLDAAQVRLDELLQRAPASASLWKTQGDVYRWRGWPRKAEETYRRAEQLSAPDNRDGARQAILMSRLDRGQWRGTVDAIERHLEQGLPSVDRDSLERDLRERRAGGLTVSGEAGSGSGSGTQSSRDWRYEARLESPRGDDGGRFFARRIGIFGEYLEQGLYAAYNTIGYELPLYPATLSLSAGQGAQLNDEPVLWGELNYAFNDHWSATFNAEWNTAQTPLRALNDGFSADLYQTSLNYHRDESGGGAISLTMLDIDDGNQRRSLTGNWRETLYQYDAWRVQAAVYAGTSKNDDVEASYFNPQSDISLGGELNVEHSLPIGYRQSFVQGVTLGTGRYWQQDEDAANTWQIGYHHRWELSPRLHLQYGVGRSKSIYDGDAEFDNVFSIGLDWRFL
ncbi:poly-beta-1,6 N-acetyl-D-glucosamine export porin PgaA [Halomonas urumqiensis]|uniref:Poly-beta-1,6 N-acetyl-D-glucosamine export porin PgaA n=1 Tax=Halomonas urumqiensis TaxID=1684789 RepID=A0A2N7UDX5_9GAMM|nr:poly-beta-1,6 N-acetyl-D-glucosamine export porin PgaA [Halomonas urumqiensis]PTB04307.1 poly-beta-1,6 N-acetyl-D-glucosamine export porin PgaA [Halomonas urumqiensis]